MIEPLGVNSHVEQWCCSYQLRTRLEVKVPGARWERYYRQVVVVQIAEHERGPVDHDMQAIIHVIGASCMACVRSGDS